jgi:hypothetical protein
VKGNKDGYSREWENLYVWDLLLVIFDGDDRPGTRKLPLFPCALASKEKYNLLRTHLDTHPLDAAFITSSPTTHPPLSAPG